VPAAPGFAVTTSPRGGRCRAPVGVVDKIRDAVQVAEERVALRGIMAAMSKNVIRISEAEAAGDFASVLDRVRAGVEIVIENGNRPIAILRPAEPTRRTISECIALLPEDSTGTLDAEFAKDVERAIESHREPLDPPKWD